MKKLFAFAIIALLAAACSVNPCFTKDQFVAGSQAFFNKVEKNHESYSEKEWKDKDATMDQFVSECYEKFSEKMTEDEKEDFWIDYFKYKYYRHGKNVLRAIELDIEKYALEIDAELEDLFDNPEKDIKKILNELYGDDLNEAIDDFVDGINDLAKKLKEWLDEE